MNRVYRNARTLVLARRAIFPIVPFLLGAIAFLGITFFISPRPASAQVPLLNTVPVTDPTLVIKEYTLDGIGFAIAKTALSSLIQSITAWVQNGFPDGGPSFARDLRATMENFADGEIAGFLNDLTGTNICDVGDIQLLLSLSETTRRNVSQQYQCTLTQSIANLEAFRDDFEQGGWIGYRRLMDHQNNPFGMYVTGSEELTRRTTQKQFNAQQELLWGRGFLAFKDASGNTLTPGAAIESQLANSLGSSVRQLELADELDELVAALLQSFTQQVFTSARGLFN